MHKQEQTNDTENKWLHEKFMWNKLMCVVCSHKVNLIDNVRHAIVVFPTNDGKIQEKILKRNSIINIT